MFAEALGLIGGIGSIVAGGQSYALGMREIEQRDRALEVQKNMGYLQYGMAMDQQRKVDEQNAYIRETNERNYLNQQVERTKIEGQRKERLSQYQREREYMADRQLEIDKAAAQNYQLELEAYLSNKTLAKEERDIALQYLDQAKAVAAGERDEDLRRLTLERLTASQEREFAIGELQRSQGIAQSERSADLAYRDQIVGQLTSMGTDLRNAYELMGEIIPPAMMSEGEIMSTIGRYEDNAVANVDRAADRVASQAEASLIDGGVSRSTAGEQRRAEITRKLGLDYDNARLSARNQAMEYIKGRDDLANSGFQRQLAGRGTTFDEINKLYAPIIEGLSANRQTLSANNYQAPVAIGSGNVIRDVRSANNYQAPLQVGSAIYNPQLSNPYANTLNLPSIADAFVTTGDYNQFAPQLQQLEGPAGYMQGAANSLNQAGAYNMAGTFMQNGLAQQSSGYAAIGGALNDLAKGGFFSKLGQNLKAGFGGNPVLPTGSNIPIPANRPYTAGLSRNAYEY